MCILNVRFNGELIRLMYIQFLAEFEL